jgi:hypothetical protein
MRAQILNDAKGWDDPNCNELGCGYQAESEPTDPKKIRGNYTHDDTSANASKGYKLTFTIAMANDYNGYIATYREYQRGDHYRKALTAYQDSNDVLMASQTLKQAYQTDVTPILQRVRLEAGGAIDPVAAYRASGYRDRVAEIRPAAGPSSGIV